MKKGYWLLAFVAIISSSAGYSAAEPGLILTYTNRVETITTLDGRSFTNINVLRATLAGITWTPGVGMGGGRIALTNLGPSEWRRLGLESNLVAAVRERTRTQTVAVMQQRADALVNQLRRDKQSDDWPYRVIDGVTNYAGATRDWYVCQGKVISVRSDAYLVEGSFRGRENGFDRLFFIYHAPRGFADDARIGPYLAKHVGTKTYTSVLGAARTVHAFDCGEKCDPPGVQLNNVEIRIAR